ncbi:hypothetical protein D3C87_1251130 [compost metagenome]
MTEHESKECQITSIALRSISKLGLLVFITTPTVLILIQNHALSLFEKTILSLFISLTFFISYKSWHLYFDAELLKNLATRKIETTDIDNCIYALFGKKIQNETLSARTQSCYKMTRHFFIYLILYVFIFLGIIVWFHF